MGVRRIEDLVASQLAGEFKRAAYDLVNRNPRAAGDFKFRDQLFDAVSSADSNVDEGFHRFGAGEMVHFLSIARSSAAEGRRWIRDGIDRGHYDAAAAAPVLELGRRTIRVIARLQQSLKPFTRRAQAAQRRLERERRNATMPSPGTRDSPPPPKRKRARQPPPPSDNG